MDSSSPKPGLLLVSYLFPPAGGIAVQRMLSMARYLPAHGFSVRVLSARNPSVPTMDQSLLRLVPEEVTVDRVWSPEIPFSFRQTLWRLSGRSSPAPSAPQAPPAAPQSPSIFKTLARRIFNPDPEIVWVPFALRAARRLVRRHSIGIVLVTAPPFSSFLIGNALKREFPHIRLVSDFRDEWLDFYLNAFEYYRSPAIRRRAERIEAETVRLSDLVVSITNSCVRRIQNRYPLCDSARFFCLPNGYDPDAFAAFESRSHASPALRVAHVGTVYPTSTPRHYLDALDSLDPETRGRFETHFIGRITPQERPSLDGRSSRIVEHGFVSQESAIAFMQETDVLLLNMTDPDFTSGKIYEYLATGKPILAISPKGGEVDDVMRATGAGWVADPAEPGAIRQSLLQIASLHQRGELRSRVDASQVRLYSRPALAASMAARLHSLLASAPAK